MRSKLNEISFCRHALCLSEIHLQQHLQQNTATFCWWWDLDKSSAMQSLKPKNPSDLHQLQSSFTWEFLYNLPYVLVFRMNSLLPNVKKPALRFFSYFVMKYFSRLRLLHVITKKCWKNTFFVVILTFVIENSLFVVIYNLKCYLKSFFLVGSFMPMRWISTWSKFTDFRSNFQKMASDVFTAKNLDVKHKKKFMKYVLNQRAIPV